jgi:hypothetical protein
MKTESKVTDEGRERVLGLIEKWKQEHPREHGELRKAYLEWMMYVVNQVTGSTQEELHEIGRLRPEEFEVFKMGADWAGRHWLRALDRQREMHWGEQYERRRLQDLMKRHTYRGKPNWKAIGEALHCTDKTVKEKALKLGLIGKGE